MKNSTKFNKKIILFIFLIILALILIHFIRNTIIIFSLSKKIIKYENINNYHEVWSTYNNETITIFDVYYKDGKSKQIITTYDYNRFIKYDETPSKVIIYRDGNGKETTYLYSEKIAYSKNYTDKDAIISPKSMSHITMFAETPWRFVSNCLKSFITSSKCNGIDAYKLSFITGNTEAYFSKETGLTLRNFSGFSYGPNDDEQNYVDCISDIMYEFNSLTDEDLLMPSTEGFAIQEN